MIEIPDTQQETMLLLTLGEVSDLVSNSHDLDETLNNIVRHIQTRFRTDVSSVYTLDTGARELTLRATVGLAPDSVGRVKMPVTEGLVGLVAERKAPVSVDDASRHPRYRYFPEAGEEAYQSFLGVPLIQGGVVQGVLVVQHVEQRKYSANEVRMLVAVAAQLGILVANSQLTQQLSEGVRRQAEGNAHETPTIPAAPLKGVIACPGYGIGRAIRFEAFDFADPDIVTRSPGPAQEERDLLFKAIADGQADLDRASRHLAELLGEEFGALLQAQRLMLEDSSVQRDLVRLVDNGASVERAVVSVAHQYLKAFQKLENPFFYERIYDIKDVFRRILNHALPKSDEKQSDDAIVVGHEVSLLELFSCDLSRVRGIAVEKGGMHSHVAILARSLGIPMLTQVDRLLSYVRAGAEILVDAEMGLVYLSPTDAHRDLARQLAEQRSLPAPESNGEPVPTPIRLETTVNLFPEVKRSIECGAEAVGLYRSEFLELARRSFLTEEEQYEVYRKMIGELNGRPMTIRTLDLRSEKLYGIADLTRECWEWRLVDQLPHVQDVVRTQLRAILRAGKGGPVRILFPMITTQRQLNRALILLDEARESLREEGVAFAEEVPVGIMIEVAAAALMAEAWIPRIDFLSIGSNDLLHSLLGIDRSDDGLVDLKTPLEPGYLRLVWRVIGHAHAAGKPVTICGEAASDLDGILALYSLGADALSLPPGHVQQVRTMFASLQLPSEPRQVGQRLVEANDIADVKAILSEEFRSM
ncbi:Phosphoenolpyruvate-protein phosphotransferase [Planctomycetes bacterium Pan216]|uniref:Phosphoenolpyruvate-protein phosphotransferase n=1 Tax=Kolteria novifilia TaxID=2527975 RepID=A0A518B4Y6_9BACT|nr:Phosphoenolpyruvate-protein phosphotransferase [Planctomycetes bacterium Pan216]